MYEPMGTLAPPPKAKEIGRDEPPAPAQGGHQVAVDVGRRGIAVGEQQHGCVGGPGFAVEGVDAVDGDAVMSDWANCSCNTSRAEFNAVLAAGNPAYPVEW